MGEYNMKMHLSLLGRTTYPPDQCIMEVLDYCRVGVLPWLVDMERFSRCS